MQKTPVKTPNRIPTRTPNKTPNKSSTPKNKTQLAAEHASTKDEISSLQIPEIKDGPNARVLRLQQSTATNFLGFTSFPNLRSLDLNETLSSLSNTSIIVALRSLFIKCINGRDISSDVIISSFNYSGLVTVALRQGMNPELNPNPEIALQDSIEYLSKADPKQVLPDSDSSLYSIEEKDDQKLITVNIKGDFYSWYILDTECRWKSLNGIKTLNNSNPNANANVQENTNSILSRLNYPLKCEVRNASIKNGKNGMKSCTIYIPEYDNKYHVYAEINGDPNEGRILSLKAPLSANVEWKYKDDGTVINQSTHILPLTPNEVGRVIECDVTLADGYPTTKLFSAPIKPGEFRFRSIRLQGELVEGDEIEFDVSTKGTKAKFIGIRILRSSKHGEWEHIAFISSNNEGNQEQNNSTENQEQNENTQNSSNNSPSKTEQRSANNSPSKTEQRSANSTPKKSPNSSPKRSRSNSPRKIPDPSEVNQKLKYRLTVYDIGCVIRAVCITDGAGPPLMLTSNERVQPSRPQFTDPNIYGAGAVGMPLFAIAQYNGGLQGNCCYEWKVENKGERERNGARAFESMSTVPIMIPKEEDIGKIVTCKMTPIRNDGSLGDTVEARFPEPISSNASGLRECFLEYRKKTRSGRLQMSVVDEKEDPYQKLFKIHEGETIIVSQPCDWVVVTQNGIKAAGHSKMFTADGGSIKGIVVMFTDEYFAIAGQIEAAQPTASDVKITVDSDSSFLTAEFKYSGGIEGRSIIQWNKNDGIRETVVGFGRSIHYGVADRGCTFKAIITPQSLDGKCGTPIESEPFLIDDNYIVDERPIVSILNSPEEIKEEDEIHVTASNVENDENRKDKYVVISEPLAQKYKIVWVSSGKYVDEGPDFKVLDKYANKPLSMLIIDRLRDSVITQCDWDNVTGLIGNIVNLQLVSSVVDENRQKIYISKLFENGKEGDSKLIWYIYEKNNPDELNQEPFEKKEPFLIVDKTFEGFYVAVEYYARNTSQADYSPPVLSNKLMVPIRHPPSITITKAEIVPNKDFTELVCKVKTEGEGKIEYEWALVDPNSSAENNEPILTGEVSKSHEITDQDFECDVYCTISVYGPKDKKPCDTAEVYPAQNVRALFTPTINQAIITSPTKNPYNEFTLGQELEVTISDYQGIPYDEVKIIWQRCEETVNNTPKNTKASPDESVETNDNDAVWKTISHDPIYTATSADIGRKIRAVVEVSATHEILEDPVYSEKYATESVLISRNNQTILRMASALFRTKKALFDAKLPMGEKVVVSLENGMLLMKGGSSVLLRVQLPSVNVDTIEGTNNRISLKARHGYNTELTFNERKMSGGTKFTPPQTRELFIETLNLFKQE